MEYTARVGEHPETVVARMFGEYVPGERRKVCNAIAGLAKANGLQRVLIDLTNCAFRSCSACDAYGFAVSLCNDFLQGTRVALVKPGSSGLDLQFVELVAGNRGLVTRGFGDELAAVAWLCDCPHRGTLS